MKLNKQQKDLLFKVWFNNYEAYELVKVFETADKNWLMNCDLKLVASQSCEYGVDLYEGECLCTTCFVIKHLTRPFIDLLKLGCNTREKVLNQARKLIDIDDHFMEELEKSYK